MSEIDWQCDGCKKLFPPRVSSSGEIDPETGEIKSRYCMPCWKIFRGDEEDE